MLIAQNETRESGSFMGDQLCSLKAAYLFVEHQPDVTKVIMSVSPTNEMHYLWEKFINKYNIELVYDDWNPGDWTIRHQTWEKWRTERHINGIQFDHYRELYLRIHGGSFYDPSKGGIVQGRQVTLCGSERGLGKRNIYQYWYCGQEHKPNELPPSVDWFDDTLVYHPQLTPERDVYISPHAKTQGNVTFTFSFWEDVVHRLIDAGITVTVGYNGHFCEDLNAHPLYKKYWGDHKQWMEQLCKHKLVACGNTGTGWLAAACGVPMITMEPPNSQMPDHRYRECGLRNIVEVVDTPNAEYVAKRITEEVQKCVVMTTGCYDVIHAGHIRHLERSRALGSKLIVALNSDSSIRKLKGPERPINPQNQRKTVLEALRCVDEVQIFDGPDAIPLIEKIKPNILTNGFGYNINNIVGKQLVESWGGRAVITCNGDASNEPSTTKIVKRIRAADIIKICRIGANSSVNPFEKLKLMADTLLTVKDLEGDIADLGAMRGGTALILRRLSPDKQLHIFDTWEGTPYDDPSCHHKKGEWAVSIEECKQLVGEDTLTNYLQGTFPNTFAGLENNKFCFVYIDMDTYQATKDAIEYFWPRMVVNGKMFIDDYGWEPCAGVKNAVDETYNIIDRHSSLNIRHTIPSLYTCILEKKSE